MATAGAAEADRELVADQHTATAGEDRRQAHQARPVYWFLLAERHLTRRVLAAILRRIWALPLPAR